MKKHYCCSDRAEKYKEKVKAATVGNKKERSTCEKDGTEHTTREKKQRREGKQQEREKKKMGGDRRVFLSCLCGMTSLCTAAVFVNQGRPGVFVGQFLREEKKEGGREEGRKARKRKKGEGKERG